MVVAEAESQYQSLYRRYRPQRFDEILGQDHVVLALRNAVRDSRVGHAYLFSGPRGTGKTSAARILAKALNCENPSEGEPDGTCDACVRIQQGTSLDVHELDAASNNGVDAMRDLVSRTALGTPGRWKVYIVDEVHMLSAAASNALLKTLEEPPSHVVFVLATTDPQKVLPTIRSRTQHFEFRLLSGDLLADLVTKVNGAANLHAPQEALDLAVRRGKGSARDTLSALDQVAAAGVVDDEHEVIDEIVEALCESDTGRSLIAIGQGIQSGRDPQRLAVDLLEYLRNAFLSVMARQLVALPDDAVDRVEEQARRLGTPLLVRAMEEIGDAMRDMRDSPETRVTLELALVRLTRSDLQTDPTALLERIEKLERSLKSSSSQAPASSAAAVEAPRPASASGEQPKQDETPSAPRLALGGLRKTKSTPKEPTAPDEPASGNEADDARGFPTRDGLVEAWGDTLLERLPQRARSRYRSGRFVAVDDNVAKFALPNSIHMQRCEEVRNEVEAVLRDFYGVRVRLSLVVEDETVRPSQSSANDHTTGANAIDASVDDDVIDIRDTVDAGGKVDTPEQRLMKAFPGAEEIG